MLKPLIWNLIPAFSLLFTPILFGHNPDPAPDLKSHMEVLEEDAGRLVIGFSFSEFDIDELFNNESLFIDLKINGMGESGEIGQPNLPVDREMIGIPGNADVKFKILSKETKVLSGPFKVRGKSGYIPINKDFEVGRIAEKFFINDTENKKYPELPIRIASDAWIRDQRVITLEVFPFQFFYSDSSLMWHKNMTVEISYFDSTPSMGLSNLLESNNPYEKFLEANLINYENAKNWRGFPNTTNKIRMTSSNAKKPSSIELPEVDQTKKLRIAVNEDGLYKITYADLAAIGILDISVDNLRLTSQGTEHSFYLLNDDMDNILDIGEELIFWGEKFRGDRFADLFSEEDGNWGVYTRQLSDGTYDNWYPQLTAEMFEKYTDTNVYWLTWNELVGKRMDVVSGTPIGATLVEKFTETRRFEEDNYWRTFPFTSENTWYWDRIQTSEELTRSYIFSLEAPALNGVDVKITGELMAEITKDDADGDHHVKISINDQEIQAFEGWWEGKSRYQFSFTVPLNVIQSGENWLKLTILPTANIPNERLFFDWFAVEYERDFSAVQDEILFKAQSGTINRFMVDSLSNDEIWVLDLQEENYPKVVEGFTLDSYEMSINTQGEKAAVPYYRVTFEGDSSTYFITTQSEIKSPSGMELVSKAMFLGYDLPDYVFISDEDLYSSTQQLASYRQSANMKTQVVNIDELYNEFTYGIRHPLAIKLYFRYLLDQFSDLPDYALLVGDGHWNFKNSPIYSNPPQHMLPNLVWVDPWQGEVDSVNLLATVVGDDPIADISIARLPVNSSVQILDYLEKLIKFDDNNSPQMWKSGYLFVADEPDEAGDFEALSDDVIKSFFIPPLGRAVHRVYNRTSSNANQELIDSINLTGYQVINYIGHGTINSWDGELMSVNDISKITNTTNFPLILSMTCLDGYWIYPDKSSLIEELIRAENKGAIAAFSPTGLGIATGHDVLNQGFFDAFFNSKVQSIGILSDYAKLELYKSGQSPDLLQTFTIFGDPLLQLNDVRVAYLPAIINNH